ncbi:TetR/AcrR family transcriptional regulator [Martelella endophytica]|uniref:HTH tetR-type domain-containing protein n=1 Tax=Martelella endophytica TaxID=1486262 RepID=A0A0D5LKX2_MAREN|nr:TetR/AcrR family transcriptional regulator [Martelella endophytica]AJY44816.1 hypothetical protein TM49_02540 [Martelella endophytica]
MARPTSEEKRTAILAAATRLVATQGTGVSTAKIARAAGVAEGTVFVYFETKAILMEALLLALEGELAKAFAFDALPGDGGREDLHHIWSRLIDWGVSHPECWRAMKRLKVSELVSERCLREGEALFVEAASVLDTTIARHGRRDMPQRFVGLMLNATAEVTYECIAGTPDEAEHYKALGFEMIWNGITGG